MTKEAIVKTLVSKILFLEKRHLGNIKLAYATIVAGVSAMMISPFVWIFFTRGIQETRNMTEISSQWLIEDLDPDIKAHSVAVWMNEHLSEMLHGIELLALPFAGSVLFMGIAAVQNGLLRLQFRKELLKQS